MFQKHIAQINRTPQRKQARPEQIENDAGGFVFQADWKTQLMRFLILGIQGGSYYAGEEKKVEEATDMLRSAIQANGEYVVKMVAEVSASGRAIKNEPALYALALALKYGDLDTRRYAAENVIVVARTGTHILHLVSYLDAMGGWGRVVRRAVSSWYTSKRASDLAYQVVKYQSRDKWSHKDVITLAHPVTRTSTDRELNGVLRWVMQGKESYGERLDRAPTAIYGMEVCKTLTDPQRVADLVDAFNLTREMVPTQMLKDPVVLRALMKGSPYNALVRNLGNLGKHGLLDDHKDIGMVINKLIDSEAIARSKMHPFGILVALMTYKSGHGTRGDGQWPVNSHILDALDIAFLEAFHNVAPTGKRILYALDNSGSMHGANVGGVPGMSAAIAQTALAMTMAKEPYIDFITFTNGLTSVRQADISPRRRLDDVVASLGRVGNGTDCATPIEWALKQSKVYDVIIISTDNQTWSGMAHPFQVAQQYSKRHHTKYIGIAMESNRSSIFDTSDPDVLDLSGFDTDGPTIVQRFINGDLG